MTHALTRAAVAMLAAVALPAVAAPLTVERVAILMRHGVRPPTKDPAMPAGIAAEAWPMWDTKPGFLTSRGAQAVETLGRADRAALAADALLPATGCPAAGSIALISDSDQRTIATGDAWAAGFAPGCPVGNAHKPQDEADPVFGAIEQGVVDYDPQAADAAVAAALPAGGIAAVEAKERTNLARLDAILCGPATSACGLTTRHSGIAPAKPGERSKLTGALDRGSTAAQILLLEYADGKPLSEVGWGRATPADVTALGSLHATEFALLARPKYLAARNVAPIAKILRQALVPPTSGSPKVTIVVGHDTNIANLGGLLDLHWQIPGFAVDDPAPGGAIVLSLLRDAHGDRFVRATYRAQPLASIRALTPDTTSIVLDIPACWKRADHLCPAGTFDRLIGEAADLVRR
ncbi:histidine-type phosphatase [Sphingomonas sp. BIUV-7]|uniref:Histidine-type phosphatase n=1 Tax=Sphingomonas natans TaxID=3063330 RepID=A0ABT8Y9G4_9SPHN|nr:histidine-type phosphatase [Sphingomonas sp. BIUV-7]MDO6414978.1 histidine-type phosphatase [Sphingomonas sp. BIUV-7]